MTEIAKMEERIVSFVPFGAADAIKLTVSIIQNLIAIPTKSGKTCSVKDAVKFMMLCRAKRLDPFEGDCFLLGYDSRDGVATFSLITAHQAYLKRAEVHPEFDGMRSGIIVDTDGGVEDIEGDFREESDTLLGGWASVYFKNRKIPTTRRLRLSRFKKPFGVWNDDPEGMIVKCAEADALRSSFPTMLGSLKDAELHRVKELDGKCSEVMLISENDKPEARIENPAQAEPLEIKEPPKEPEKEEELGQFVIGEGFTWDHFKEAAIAGGWIDGIENFNGFDEIPAKRARTVLRARDGLLKGLQQIREAQSK